MSSHRRRLQFHQHRRESNTNDTTSSSVVSSAGDHGGPLSSTVSEWTEGDDTSIEGHANDDAFDDSAMPRRRYDPQQQQAQGQPQSSAHETSFRSSDNDGSQVTFSDLTSTPTWLSGRGLGGVTDLDVDRRDQVRGSLDRGLERDHDSFMSSDFSDQSSVGTGEISSSFTDSNTSVSSGGNHPIAASSPAHASTYGSSQQQGHQQHHPLTAPAPSLHKQQQTAQHYTRPKRQGPQHHSSLRSTFSRGGRNVELESINESSMESATTGSSSSSSPCTSATSSQESAEIPHMIDPTIASGAMEGRSSPRQQSRSPQSQQQRSSSSSPSSADPRSSGAIGSLGGNNRARSWRLAALRRNQQLGDSGGTGMTSQNTPGGDSSTAASFFSLSSFRISVPSSLSSNSSYSASTWTSSSEDDTTTESGSAVGDQTHPNQQQLHHPGHQVRQSVQVPYTTEGLEAVEGDYEEEGDQRYDPRHPSPQGSSSPRGRVSPHSKGAYNESSSQSTSTESYLRVGKKMMQSGSLSTEPTLPDHPRVVAKHQLSDEKEKNKRRGITPGARQDSADTRGTAESTPSSSFDRPGGDVAAPSGQQENQEQQRQTVRNRLFQRKSQLPPHPRLKQKERDQKGLALAPSKSTSTDDIVDKHKNSKMNFKKQNSSHTMSTSSPTAASSLLSSNATLATIADEEVGGRGGHEDDRSSPQRRRPQRGGNRRGIISGSHDRDLTEEEAKMEIGFQQKEGDVDESDAERGLQTSLSASTSSSRQRDLVDPIERERQDRAEIDRILKEAASKPRQTSIPRSILRNTGRVLARLGSGSTNSSGRNGHNIKNSPRSNQSPPQTSTGNARDDVALQVRDSNRNVSVLSHDKQDRYQKSRLWCLCAPVRTKTDTCITVAFVQALLAFIAVMIYFEVTWEQVIRTFTIGASR